ncbi:MAG: hypothetical protein JSS44_11320 [Proteobacteria bacterium]|nr:hypothetical protein [Pseudomonadota bacterium]
MTASTLLKWSECQEEDTLYEAFLPGHDQDGQTWLLRASRNGHILAERHIPMVWRPRFGPDQGDVAHLESELERLIDDLRTEPSPHATDGPYIPGPVEVDPPDPYEHAALHALLEDYTSATVALELTPSAHLSLLDLPTGYSLDGLYPVAITAKRAERMRRLIALQRVLERYPALVASKPALLAAVTTDELTAIKQMLEDAGVPT